MADQQTTERTEKTSRTLDSEQERMIKERPAEQTPSSQGSAQGSQGTEQDTERTER